MELATSVSSPILSKIGEKLTELTTNQVRYLFCFKSIVKELTREQGNLKLAQDRVQHDVDRAIRNTEEIEKDVQKWLADVSNVMLDALKLEEEIQVNKRCLSGQCPNWIWRYQLSKKAEEKRDAMSNLLDIGKFNKVSYPPTLSGIEFFAPKDFELFETSKCVFDKIIEAFKDDTTNIIGLYGMGGVGKTTLAKAVGNKAKDDNIFYELIMVNVSRNSIENIQDQIAESLSLKFDEKTQTGRARRLYLRFTTEKKFLVILDDVWKKIDLKNTIGVSFDAGCKGCKILLTTRLEQVCSDMDCQRKIQLNVLSEKEGLALFKYHASIGENSPTLNALAIDVALECKGLPLALVTIGGALKDKGIDEWKVVSQKLKKSKLVDIHNVVDDNVDVYTCLKLSYDYLQSNEIKLTFLLCSLFPEDYIIPLEELVRYGIGIDLYPDVDSIDEARSQLRVMLNKLKASCLLLDAGDGKSWKMHDMVRDVALEIALKENKFLGKAGMGLTEWPKEESMKDNIAVSLMDNRIHELPIGLICPKLEILFLCGKYQIYFSHVPVEFFEEMRSLKVFTLSSRFLALKSLQFLTNLRTLHLKYCRLIDMSSLGKLKKLEILSLEGSFYDELPKELQELGKLRLLDLIQCVELKRIPYNVIPRLSQLEELYIGSKSFRDWEVEETSGETIPNNASLSELNSLPRLAILSLDIDAKCINKHLAFPKLKSYDISMCGYCSNYPTTRSLRLEDIEASSFVAFKALYPTLQYLGVNNVVGCQNIVPSIDKEGLNELNSLALEDCNEMECIIDTKDQQWLPAFAFSNLVKVSLKRMNHLKELCYCGRYPSGFLEKLETLNVTSCRAMLSLFPLMLFQRLQKLKQMTIQGCDELQEVFQLEGLCHLCEQNDLVPLLSLKELILTDLPELKCIWKGPIRNASLQSLTNIEVAHCENLMYLLSISLARSLVQLKSLKIRSCSNLKHIVEQNKLEDNKGVENETEIAFPNIRKLELGALKNLINFCSENYYLSWLALEELIIYDCFTLTMSFITQHEVIVQALKQKVRVLKVENCDNLHDTITELLTHGLEALEELNIGQCGVKVVFQLENLVSNGKDHKLSFPRLKMLKLVALERLEGLCKGPMHNLNLQTLSALHVTGCHRLKHIFTIPFARNLLQLQELTVFYCKELEQLMVKDDTDMRDDNDIVLPKLKYLSLKYLRSLNNLGPVCYHFVFPSLKILIVKNSGPKMTTRFSVAQNGFVHAQTLEDEKAQAINIECWELKEIQTKLPPYIH